MSHLSARQRLRVAIPVFLVLGIGIWAGTTYLRRPASNADVVASGTIEALQVSIASKIPGRIEQVRAREGETVRAGAVLVTMEGRELASQIDQTRAAVEVARARLAQARAALALQQQQVAAQVAQAQAALDVAVVRAQQAQDAQRLTVSQADLAVAQAEAALQAAVANSAVVQVNRDRTTEDLARLERLYREGAISAQQVEAARAAHDAANAQHDAALKTVAQAEVALRLARANQAQVGIREQDVAATQAQVRQAQAALRTAMAGVELIAQRRADVAAAEAQVTQAEAALRTVVEQQKNLTIPSPVSGVVVAKHANAGEIVGAGAPILTVADLDQVWIRLFIPLPRQGDIAMGARAEVTTDAVPGRTFTGTVTEISQQAEFTPRNVQTREERVKLVFAVKVTIPNPDHLLKPGWPADAVIKTRNRGNGETRKRERASHESRVTSR